MSKIMQENGTIEIKLPVISLKQKTKSYNDRYVIHNESNIGTIKALINVYNKKIIMFTYTNKKESDEFFNYYEIEEDDNDFFNGYFDEEEDFYSYYSSYYVDYCDYDYYYFEDYDNDKYFNLSFDIEEEDDNEYFNWLFDVEEEYYCKYYNDCEYYYADYHGYDFNYFIDNMPIN